MGRNHILRINDKSEKELFVKRILYIGIRRDWTRNSRVFFVKKQQSGDAIIGSGVLQTVIELAELDDAEKEMCIKNNWYGRMVFEKLARFLPAIDTAAIAEKNPAFLHGLEISDADFAVIEKAANIRINT